MSGSSSRLQVLGVASNSKILPRLVTPNLSGKVVKPKGGLKDLKSQLSWAKEKSEISPEKDKSAGASDVSEFFRTPKPGPKPTPKSSPKPAPKKTVVDLTEDDSQPDASLDLPEEPLDPDSQNSFKVSVKAMQIGIGDHIKETQFFKPSAELRFENDKDLTFTLIGTDVNRKFDSDNFNWRIIYVTTPIEALGKNIRPGKNVPGLILFPPNDPIGKGDTQTHLEYLLQAPLDSVLFICSSQQEVDKFHCELKKTVIGCQGKRRRSSPNLMRAKTMSDIEKVQKVISPSNFIKYFTETEKKTEAKLATRTDTLLIYPDNSPDAIAITESDVELLDEGRLLNDSVIDFWLKYFQAKLSSSTGPRFYFYNTFFYKSMKKPEIRRWTLKVNLFDYDYLVIPINRSFHWKVAIVCNLKKIPILMQRLKEHYATKAQNPKTGKVTEDNMSPTKKTAGSDQPTNFSTLLSKLMPDEKMWPSIVVFDSLGTSVASEKPFFTKIRTYLRDEWIARFIEHPEKYAKHKGENSAQKEDTSNPSNGEARVSSASKNLPSELAAFFDEAAIRNFAPRVPRQTNHIDCGVFVLKYVEQFCENPPKSFERLEFNDNFGEYWFTHRDVQQMRVTVKTALLGLIKVFPGNKDKQDIIQRLEQSLQNLKPKKPSSPSFSSYSRSSFTGPFTYSASTPSTPTTTKSSTTASTSANTSPTSVISKSTNFRSGNIATSKSETKASKNEHKNIKNVSTGSITRRDYKSSVPALASFPIEPAFASTNTTTYSKKKRRISLENPQKDDDLQESPAKKSKLFHEPKEINIELDDPLDEEIQIPTTLVLSKEDSTPRKDGAEEEDETSVPFDAEDDGSALNTQKTSEVDIAPPSQDIYEDSDDQMQIEIESVPPKKPKNPKYTLDDDLDDLQEKKSLSFDSEQPKTQLDEPTAEYMKKGKSGNRGKEDEKGSDSDASKEVDDQTPKKQPKQNLSLTYTDEEED